MQLVGHCNYMRNNGAACYQGDPWEQRFYYRCKLKGGISAISSNLICVMTEPGNS